MFCGPISKEDINFIHSFPVSGESKALIGN